MNYQITSDNIEMSPSMQNLAQAKMHKIEERLKNVPDDLKSARIVMNTLKDDQFEAKIHIVVRGKEYFTQQTGYTLESAVISAVDRLERDLQTDKIITVEEDWQDAREAKRFDPEDPEKLEEEIVA